MGEGIITRRGGAGEYIKSIQRGVVTLSTNASVTVSISAINTSNAIIIGSNVFSSGNWGLPITKIRSRINSSTQIEFLRNTAEASSNANIDIAYQVIEFNKVKSKQTGNYSLTTTAEQAVTITSVNTAKSAIFSSYTTNYVFSSGDEVRDTRELMMLRDRIASATSINFWIRQPTVSIDWQVIEFE